MARAGTSALFTSFDIRSIVVQDGWAHIVITYDVTVAQIRIYVDGVLRTTNSTSAFSALEPDANFYFGTDVSGNNPAFCELDELFIDNRVWPAEEVLAVFNLPNGLPRTLI